MKTREETAQLKRDLLAKLNVLELLTRKHATSHKEIAANGHGLQIKILRELGYADYSAIKGTTDKSCYIITQKGRDYLERALAGAAAEFR